MHGKVQAWVKVYLQVDVFVCTEDRTAGAVMTGVEFVMHLKSSLTRPEPRPDEIT